MQKVTFTTSDNVDLYVEVHGSVGQPLMIWSHGFTGSGRNWRSSMRQFPDFCHVIYDQRGHARSAAPELPEAYTHERLALDVIELFDFCQNNLAMNAPKLFLAGLSLGAMVTYKVLELKPSLLDAAIISSLPDPTAKESISGKAHDFAEAILSQGLEAAGDIYVWGSDSGMSSKDAALVKQGFLEHASHSLAYILQQTLSQLPSSEDMASSLLKTKTPVLVLAGISDENALSYSGRVMASLIGEKPNVNYVTFAGGHLLNLTSNKLFCEYVGRFLK
ncbi:MAG: hypothetical protein CMD81_14845 [Gammaproteobacteria bacterium]|nr:hypothetical protein [Gammaproteobacteria bacterium]HBF07209.1 hypothetical protein [Gammaproteobacteria bacterium]|tara:strand:+ start:18139 stop:18966 length:828 start_codon:yes stop_codon:yes gene_type:complete